MYEIWSVILKPFDKKSRKSRRSGMEKREDNKVQLHSEVKTCN